MEFNSLTLTLNNFIAAFSGGSARLQGATSSLLGILIAIEILLLGLWTALGGGENVVASFKKILHVGAWVWLAQAFPTLSKAFRDSLVQAGLTAGGGGDVSLLADPSRIAGYGLDATAPLTQKLAELGMTDLSDLFVFELGYLAIMACFVIMAIHVFMAVLEYYLFAALVGIFLPFGLFGPTKFLAEKAVGAVVASSVKLMVLAFLLSVVDPVLSHIHFAGPTITFNELWSVFLTVCALMLFCWRAPSLASALLGGSPHLGAGDVLGAAAGAVAAGFVAVRGTAMAGKAAASMSAAAIGGGTAAARGASAVAEGYSRSAAAAGGSGGSGSSENTRAGGGETSAAGAASSGSSAAPGASSSLVQSAMGKIGSSTSTTAGGNASSPGGSPSSSAPSSRTASAGSSPSARSGGSTSGTRSVAGGSGNGSASASASSAAPATSTQPSSPAKPPGSPPSPPSAAA